MIQPINESEKNRIRNLHREHFILNEEMIGDTDDIKGQALYHISALPTDKRETPGAIRTLLSSILNQLIAS